MNRQSIGRKSDKTVREKAKALYLSAFPKEERVPWWMLCCGAALGKIQIDAYLEEDTFCAFSVSCKSDALIFIGFFAVEQSLRSKGYGAKILQSLQRHHQNRPLVLHVEPLEEGAPNLIDRKRRLAFYRKNGFFETGYKVREVGGKFSVLSTSTSLDIDSYKNLFRKMTFGLWRIKVYGEAKKNGK